MSETILSILMPALTNRDSTALRNKINSQVDQYNNSSKTESKVEFIVNEDSGELTSGSKRNALAKSSKGEYRCFVDDDDDVSDDYVQSLAEGCETGVDVVGFSVEFTNRLNREKWRLGPYPDIRHYGLMCCNHLCAWKASIANRVPWHPHFGYGDDQLWYKPLLALSIPKTFLTIDSTLYYYQYSADVSVNQNPSVKQESFQNIKSNYLMKYYLYEDNICPQVYNTALESEDTVVIVTTECPHKVIPRTNPVVVVRLA